MGDSKVTRRANLLGFVALTFAFLAGTVFALIALNSTSRATAAPAVSSGHLMISTADFSGYSGDNLLLKSGQTGGYVAPIHLPQGARITQITSYFSVTVPLSFATFISIEQQSRATFTPLGTIAIPSNVQMGTDIASSNSISTALIDNSQYAYHIRVSTDGTINNPPPPCPPGSTCGNSTMALSPDQYPLYQVRIDYTFDAYLPGVSR